MSFSADQIPEDLRYPIGKFDRSAAPTPESRSRSIDIITELPQKLTEAVAGLHDDQLDTPYRPEGWTVRQAVHHVADSHINSFCRFKLALTEDVPTIRPYEEGEWAVLADSRLPLEASMKIIEGVHERWAALLSTMSDADFARRLIHPASGEWTLDEMLGMYAWHSRHHTAHITRLREREGW